jgi:hypothetical protein
VSQLIAGQKMSRAQYDAIKAVRSSELKVAAKSLWHFNENQRGKTEVSGAKKKGWDLGTLAHSVCLENDISSIRIFDGTKEDGSEYSVPRSSKGFKEMVEQNPNKYVITKEEFKSLCDKRAAFWDCADVKEAMAGVDVEVAFCAQDPITGLWLKCQTDFVSLAENRFGDFKGVPDASEYGVGKFAGKAKWPIQIGHYAYVIELATGVKMGRFEFIAQEYKAPYYTETHKLSEMDWENCAIAYRGLLNRLAIAIKENTWPGYKKRGALVLPPWAYEFEEIEEDNEWEVA